MSGGGKRRKKGKNGELDLPYLRKIVSRRAALSTAAKVGITAVVVGAAAGVGGYLAGSAAAPAVPSTVTKTVEKTVTTTKSVGAATVTETATVTKTATKTVEKTVTVTGTPTVTPTKEMFKGVKITVATLACGEIDVSGVCYWYAKKFKELTGGEMEVIEIPYGDLHVKILADVTTGAGKYDIFEPMSFLMGDLLAGDYVWCIDQWIDDPRFPKWYPEDVPYPIAIQSRWGGHWYGVPLDCDAWFLFWNMRYMNKWLRDKDKRREFKDRYGYELNPYKWLRDRELTWQKVRDMAEFFTGWDWNEDGEPDYGIVMALKSGEQGPYWWDSFVAPFVVSPGPMMDRYHNIFWHDPETMEPLLKHPGFVEGTKLFYEINKKCGPPEAISFSFAEIYDFYLMKQKAMFLTGPPDPFSYAGYPEWSRLRGYQMTAPIPGSEIFYDREEGRLVERTNLIGNASGGSWHFWISKLSKNPEACYWISAYMATPKEHLETTSYKYFPTGVDPGFRTDLLRDYGGKATLADFNLPGDFKDPGYPKAKYHEADLRRGHIAVHNNYYAMDGQYTYYRIPGAAAVLTIIDTHIIGELMTGAVSVEEALDRCYREIEKLIDEYGREKLADWYQKSINYGKPNPYRRELWIWDDRVVPKDLIFD